MINGSAASLRFLVSAALLENTGACWQLGRLTQGLLGLTKTPGRIYAQSS